MVDMITRKDIPCWYEIGWDAKKTAFILRIHKDFIRNAGTIKSSAPILAELMKKFKFSSFAGDLAGKFLGFDKVLKNIGEADGFISFIGRVPVTERKTDKKCQYCNGSGRDPILEWNKCWRCKGQKYEISDERKTTYALSLSLEVFVNFAFSPKRHTSSKSVQLMQVGLVLRHEPDRAVVGIGGEISRALHNWIRSLGENVELEESSLAMKSAWFKMRPFSKSVYDRRDYTAVIRDVGFVSMDCPGDACGVFTDRDYPNDEGGCRLADHNVDTVFQQLTLLAGLAALNTKARKEMQNGLTSL